MEPTNRLENTDSQAKIIQIEPIKLQWWWLILPFLPLVILFIDLLVGPFVFPWSKSSIVERLGYLFQGSTYSLIIPCLWLGAVLLCVQRARRANQPKSAVNLLNIACVMILIPYIVLPALVLVSEIGYALNPQPCNYPAAGTEIYCGKYGPLDGGTIPRIILNNAIGPVIFLLYVGMVLKERSKVLRVVDRPTP